ncbi:hypothetical protein KY359_00245 [Candidatus Woesearchaeota archaeon]|nr:hypothetical protein [Candidatus Woesearchaeota archaeon]
MGLIEKVQSGLRSTCYSVRECVESRRQQLEWQSRKYCMLSMYLPECACPLQGGHEEGVALSTCLRDDYLRELSERNPTNTKRY